MNTTDSKPGDLIKITYNKYVPAMIGLCLGMDSGRGHSAVTVLGGTDLGDYDGACVEVFGWDEGSV